jgi:7-cyano-7-deazaguanine synthase in queuosine biosynthesis
MIKIPECNRVGVSFSAGLDSTLLLSLLILELRATEREHIPIVAFTTHKSTGEAEYTERMIELIRKHFNRKVEHINDLPNSPEYEEQGVADPDNIRRIYNYYDNDIKIYVGVNNSNNCPHKLPWKYTRFKHYDSPFLDYSKDQLLKMYQFIGIEHLIPYTHSCAQQKHGNCGKCYSCRERQWAFDQLGLENPETIPIE